MAPTSRPALEPTWGFFLAVNLPEREVDHPTSSTERSQMRGATPLLRLYGFMASTGKNSPFTMTRILPHQRYSYRTNYFVSLFR